MEDKQKSKAVEEQVTLTAKDCFKCRQRIFSEFYIHLVVGVGLFLAAAIWLGVKVHVLAGLGLAIIAVCVYCISVEDRMRKVLGLAYTSILGGVRLAVVDPQCQTKWDRSIRRIPCRVMWLDVIAIGGRTGRQKADGEVTVVYIPSSVKRIEKNAFEGMTALATLVFEGSAEQWDKVEKLADLSGLQVTVKES